MDDMPQGKETVSDKEIIEFMRSDQDPAYTTSELADHFEMSSEGIRGRLEDLEKRGRIFKKKPSSRTVIWWSDSDDGAQAFCV
jgi:predicted ArsR family transcriptional regulator